MVEHNDDFGSSSPPPEPSSGPRHEGGEPASPAYNEAHEAAFKHSQPARPVDDGLPRHPVFPMVLGAAMVLALVVAWVLNSKPAESSGPAPGGTAPAAATPAPVAGPGDGVK